MIEVLTPREMGEADRLTIAAGTSGYELMERAGTEVAHAAADMAAAGSEILVLAGTGNNGGDGFVAARLLAARGFSVRVALLGSRETLQGDALSASLAYPGPLQRASSEMSLDAALIIDALFGAGLSRPLDGEAAQLVERVVGSGAKVLSVDLPSGVDGATGAVCGTAMRADATVTFFRMKPGHLLLPGRAHCGRVTVKPIGISDAVPAVLNVSLFHNVPDLWRTSLPRPSLHGHKYDRGHVLVVSGPALSTGAARLAAMGALRAGAGLVTLASPPDALTVNAAHLTAIMLKEMRGASGLSALLADKRFRAAVIGPGTGVGAETRDLVRSALDTECIAVLDADALTSFADAPHALWTAIGEREAATVLTPHDGEFARIFPDLGDIASKVERARAAALRSGAVTVLKGADSVVANPDGWASVSSHGPPWLATAGSGDVLAGIIAGFCAQGAPAVEAASAAVWVHADAARRFGPGLIAEDLPNLLPRALRFVMNRAASGG